MKFNVCIIENDPMYMKELIHYLNEWKNKKNCSLNITCHSSGENFFKYKTDLNYHIFFLDIKLEKLTGLEIAKILRKQCCPGEIVFLTSFHEYVFEGYYVHALNYLLKPVSTEEINFCMDYVLNKFTGEQYQYCYRGTKFKIPFRNIIYFSSRIHNIEIVTIDEQYIEAKKLHTLQKELPSQFLQCHRGIIINTDHILQLSRKEVTLTNNIKLPVSATYTENVQQAFFKQIEKITYF